MKLELKILRQHWIKDEGKSDNKDLCSHGEVLLKIGEEQLSDRSSGSWTLSVSALFLMRTLVDDYKTGDFGNQLLPCCGHFMFIEEETNGLHILGCPNGIDWDVKHHKNIVELTTEKGNSTIIPSDEYRNSIINFVEEVEDFYGNYKEKELPDDQHTEEAFRQFWKEWNELKEQIKNRDTN